MNNVYEIDSDTMHMSEKGQMEHRVQQVTFTKHVKGGKDIVHHARITYLSAPRSRQAPGAQGGQRPHVI